MKKAFLIVSATVFALTATGASAQLGGLFADRLGLPQNGEVGGVYLKKNQVRTYVRSQPYEQVDLYGKAITKVAEMTRDKGYMRFGVTKYDCSTTLLNNQPIGNSCMVFATMLGDGEEAKPKGKRKVYYYDVNAVLSGDIMRPTE